MRGERREKEEEERGERKEETFVVGLYRESTRLGRGQRKTENTGTRRREE